jgi:hypothetical protein
MKSDSSRDTFDARKHYSGVRMQQGRVQVDADWNEQHEIVAHRVRTEAADLIGRCGGPLHHAAFHIVASPADLSAEERALPENAPIAGVSGSDFLISAGRYYVDGVLCENERLTSYLNQPDLPGGVRIATPGLYIVYLDAWQRHLTVLDDPSIREVALGGPDTATRTKTVWQVKYWFAGAAAAGNCLTTFADFDAAIAPGTGTLAARAKPDPTSTNPCIVPPGAGYRGLENQLYRVEVHDAGAAIDATTAGTAVTRVVNTSNQVQFTGSASWTVGQAVEIFSGKAGSDPMNGTLAAIVAKDDPSKTLTLSIAVADLGLEEPHLRAVGASYKWSRNNGAIVTAIESIDGADVTVHDLGPDSVLGFSEGQWIEISDDARELNGLPGQLARISRIDRAINLITLSAAPRPLSTQAGGVDKTLHPKLRGWDGIGAIKFHPLTTEDHVLDLEDGVEVRFAAGTFRSGDYWTIPARTATADAQSGNIEWPHDAAGAPLAQLPFGIRHRYCRLAMLQWNGRTFGAIEDCRRLFPPVTELTSLFYVSGDGQEAMPDLTQPAQLVQLPQQLIVGVANGRWPVPNAKVRLKVTLGNGHVLPGAQGGVQVDPVTLDVRTDAAGLASCAWQIDATTRSQQLTATLFDADDRAVHLPVIFTANPSVAAQVAYDPGRCKSLQGQKTVQQAIGQLAQLVSLYEAGGNNQQGAPGAALAPLRVLAASACGPVEGRRVNFKVLGPSGTVAPDEAATDANGFATTVWTLGASPGRQEVEATLSGDGLAAPTSVRFTASLGAASEAGIEIRFVRTLADGGKDLVNDTLVEVTRLDKGIDIECSELLAPESVGASPNPPSRFPAAVAEKPTCTLTLDLPYPIGTDRNFWNDNFPVVGFQSVIVACTVVARENVIRWTPTTSANSWLQTVLLKRLQDNQVADRVLARLTLKGNFIYGGERARELVYLDGQAFGIPGAGGRVALRLPSGDGRKGGDFESWFWLIAR